MIIRSGFSDCWTFMINVHLLSGSIHTRDHSHFLPTVFIFEVPVWGAVGSWFAGSGLVRVILYSHPLPFSCLTRWVLAPNPAHWRCRCARVLCLRIRKWGRKQGRLWCRPLQQWTILTMTVHTNFPEGLQRLRTDFTPRADLTIDFPSSLVPSEEANLSLPFWHFWGWRY